MGSFFLHFPPTMAVVLTVGGGGGVARACIGICIGNPSV
jgi:hypothetical protein